MADTMTRILVPVDFSPGTDRLIQYALTLARCLGATVTLFHVIEEPTVAGAWSVDIYVPETPGSLAAMTAEAEEQMATRKRAAAAAGATVATMIVIGRPADAIVEYAKRCGYDWIVIGTHGLTGLAHILLGSVAERVVRRAPCPVLTVRAAGAGEDADHAAA